MSNNKRGWLVVLAGMGINLAFGVLYAWSIFAKTLIDTEGWTRTEASLPYTTAIFMFALMMIPAGKLQDKFGARITASFGGLLTGIGLISASFFPTLPGLIVSFGILAGSGIGLGYASATPAAVKWFPAEKKGIVTGIVVAGFGLSTLYMAPLTKYLIGSYGIFTSFKILGAAFLIIVISLSQLFKNPEEVSTAKEVGSAKAGDTVELDWKAMIKTPQFYQLWVMFAAGALGGLMIIGHLSKIVSIQLGKDIGFILVALIALFNASGRPLSGLISDKIGRGKTMLFLYLAQGLIFLIFSNLTSFTTLLFGVAVITFSYGGMFAVYPSAISDFYGKKNLGFNYGILFSAWGIGGVTGPMIAGKFADMTGSYDIAYYIAATLCFIAAFVAWRLKPYKA